MREVIVEPLLKPNQMIDFSIQAAVILVNYRLIISTEGQQLSHLPVGGFGFSTLTMECCAPAPLVYGVDDGKRCLVFK